MTKTENIYKVIGELIEEINNLRIDLSATKKEVFDLRQALASHVPSTEEEGTAVAPEQATKTEVAPTARVVTTEEYEPEEEDRVYSGVRDHHGNKLYLHDLVTLRTSSGGIFAIRGKYQKGDTAYISGVTSNYDIKVKDPNSPKLQHTVRKGMNVDKL